MTIRNCRGIFLVAKKGPTSRKFCAARQYASFGRIIYSLATFSRCCRKTPWGDGPQFATLYRAFRDHCVRKTNTLLLGPTSRKFCAIGQNTHFRASFIALAHVLPRLQKNPLGNGPKFEKQFYSVFILHETSNIRLSIC